MARLESPDELPDFQFLGIRTGHESRYQAGFLGIQVRSSDSSLSMSIGFDR